MRNLPPGVIVLLNLTCCDTWEIKHILIQEVWGRSWDPQHLMRLQDDLLPTLDSKAFCWRCLDLAAEETPGKETLKNIGAYVLYAEDFVSTVCGLRFRTFQSSVYDCNIQLSILSNDFYFPEYNYLSLTRASHLYIRWIHILEENFIVVINSHVLWYVGWCFQSLPNLRNRSPHSQAPHWSAVHSLGQKVVVEQQNITDVSETEPPLAYAIAHHSLAMLV